MRDTYGRYAIMLLYAFLTHAHVVLRFRHFLHFDSHSGSNNRHAERLAAKLCSLDDDDFNHPPHHHPIHLSSNSVCHVLPCPQQSNAYDCGMYVVECTRWLLNHSTIGSGGLDLLEADPTEVGKKMLSMVSLKI